MKPGVNRGEVASGSRCCAESETEESGSSRFLSSMGDCCGEVNEANPDRTCSNSLVALSLVVSNTVSPFNILKATQKEGPYLLLDGSHKRAKPRSPLR